MFHSRQLHLDHLAAYPRGVPVSPKPTAIAVMILIHQIQNPRNFWN